MPVTAIDCKCNKLKPIFNIEIVTWASHERHLRLVREQVFIVEQNVPTWVEWDEHDKTATHLLAYDAERRPIGCARLLETGRVGRMGVFKAWRGCGVGRALLDKAITIFKEKGFSKVTLSSQTHAIQFYEKAGFCVISEAYIDVNIWHVDMQLIL
jgi:predicted GNAT family N-acyltransferase